MDFPIEPDGSTTLKNTASAIADALRVVRQTQAILELQGDVLILRSRDNVHIYALGLIDNGDKRYPRG